MAPCARPPTSCVSSGIAAEMHLSASGLDPAQPNPVSIASIVHEGAPPWFAPLRLTGVVQPKADEVAFDLELGRPAGDLKMRVRGQHDLARAAGHAKLDLAPVRFAPDRLQPHSVGAIAGGGAWKTYPASSRCAAHSAGAQAPACVPIWTCWSKTWRSAPARRALPRSTA